MGEGTSVSVSVCARQTLATATAVNTWKARTTLGFMGKLRQRPGVGLGWAGQGSEVIPEVQLRRRAWRRVRFEDSTSIYTLFLTKDKHVSQCPPHELLQQSLMSRRKERHPQDGPSP